MSIEITSRETKAEVSSSATSDRDLISLTLSCGPSTLLLEELSMSIPVLQIDSNPLPGPDDPPSYGGAETVGCEPGAHEHTVPARLPQSSQTLPSPRSDANPEVAERVSGAVSRARDAVSGVLSAAFLNPSSVDMGPNAPPSGSDRRYILQEAVRQKERVDAVMREQLMELDSDFLRQVGHIQQQAAQSMLMSATEIEAKKRSQLAQLARQTPAAETGVPQAAANLQKKYHAWVPTSQQARRVG